MTSHPDRPFGLEDLLTAPEDGYRYEIIDGALVVNAAPTWRHQQITARLLRILEDAAPDGTVVLPAPVWRISAVQIPEPDVVVVDQSGLGEVAVEGIPVVVVEILSPSNRGSDLVRKRQLYAEAGCPNYWIVDPEGPTVTVLHLSGDGYEEVQAVGGRQLLSTSRPFALEFSAIDL